MPSADDLPETITANAWTGSAEDSTGELGRDTVAWAKRPAPGNLQMLAARRPNLRDWADPDVGWGLIVEHRGDGSPADNANLAGYPEPVRALVAHRKGVVFGWDPADGIDRLIRYLPDGTTRKVPIGDIARGTGPSALPRYLLILGGPTRIPWIVQYTLNLCAAVGRLDLDDAGLENYVDAALNDWAETPLDASQCVLWSVDQGGTEITSLMKSTIAVPLLDKLNADRQIGHNARLLTDGDATHPKLIGSLSSHQPALIVTTSHGVTAPLGDPAKMRADLGLPADRTGGALPMAALLEAWQPRGAVWYAHACCSAGSDTGSTFAGLFGTSRMAATLSGIGSLGAQSAPLPRALLGAKKPLRAFIGHVEPTFDWTLTTPDLKQGLTASLTRALYDELFAEEPMTVGGAFEGYFLHVGHQFSLWATAREQMRSFTPGAERRALRSQLAALDRRSLVIHGDPAVALPALG